MFNDKGDGDGPPGRNGVKRVQVNGEASPHIKPEVHKPEVSPRIP